MVVRGRRDRFDINQGEVGDCWFLAALANLAENEEGFRRVVPENQSLSGGTYAGIVRFRFYRFGRWQEVVIDDRLPTVGGRLVYVRAEEGNEFWSPLLEKAYAKLHGSYAALEGGWPVEAAVDFSGGIPEMVTLLSLNNRRLESTRLFHNLLWAHRRNAFMACSLTGSPHRRRRSEGAWWPGTPTP